MRFNFIMISSFQCAPLTGGEMQSNRVSQIRRERANRGLYTFTQIEASVHFCSVVVDYASKTAKLPSAADIASVPFGFEILNFGLEIQESCIFEFSDSPIVILKKEALQLAIAVSSWHSPTSTCSRARPLTEPGISTSTGSDECGRRSRISFLLLLLSSLPKRPHEDCGREQGLDEERNSSNPICR
jgi:hypothetical protein